MDSSCQAARRRGYAMDMDTPTHARTVERTAWWLRSDMGLRDATDPPVAGPLATTHARCDLHGIGHGRAVGHARFTAFILATAAAIALLLGSRPASAAPNDPGQPIATAVGAGLGALSLAGYAVSRVLEQRTRYHVWLQCETRPVSTADVQDLVDAVDEVKRRSDRAWYPHQAWLIAPAVSDAAATLARASGVRCFIRDGGQTREV